MTVAQQTLALETPEDIRRQFSQLEKVERVMVRGGWWTLAELAKEVQGSEAGVSARLRDLRKRGYTVERERVVGLNGVWRYRVR